MRHFAWGVMACALALGTACNKASRASEVDREPQAPPASATPAASAPAASAEPAAGVLAPDSAPAALRAAELKLLAPGREPRRALRYQPAAGQKEQMRAKLSIPSLTMSVNGKPLPAQKLPTTLMDFSTSVVEIEADGDCRYTFGLDQMSAAKTAGVDPNLVRLVKQAYDTIGKIQGSGVVSPRGFNVDMKVNLPENLPPQLQQSVRGVEQAMQQISALLPEEPVGVGARWESKSSVAMNQMAVQQLTTYEIEQLSEHGARLKVAVVQTAPKQTISQQGATVELSSLEATGDGSMQVDFKRLIPARAVLTLNLATEMAAQGQVTQVKTKMVVESGKR